MKIVLKLSLVIIPVSLLLGCLSSPKVQETNSKEEAVTIDVSLDPSLMSNDASLASWLAYAIIIADEMNTYYTQQPSGNFILTFAIELSAREGMIEQYVSLKNNGDLPETYQYVEELLLIENAGFLEEYVFFSFNPGTWENDKGFIEADFTNWKEINLSNHQPLTLATIEKR